jgi:hypothetical protein
MKNDLLVCVFIFFEVKVISFLPKPLLSSGFRGLLLDDGGLVILILCRSLGHFRGLLLFPFESLHLGDAKAKRDGPEGFGGEHCPKPCNRMKYIY